MQRLVWATGTPEFLDRPYWPSSGTFNKAWSVANSMEGEGSGLFAWSVLRGLHGARIFVLSGNQLPSPDYGSVPEFHLPFDPVYFSLDVPMKSARLCGALVGTQPNRTTVIVPFVLLPGHSSPVFVGYGWPEYDPPVWKVETIRGYPHTLVLESCAVVMKALAVLDLVAA